jgi:hypothetical protein
MNIMLGFVLPVVLFFSGAKEAARIGFWYCVGLVLGGLYWLAYVPPLSWYEIQMIAEGLLAIAIWILNRR